MNLHELDTIESIKKYIFGGQAIFSIHNESNNRHFTYKVVQSKKPVRDLYWVFVLTRPENKNKEHYKYIGAVSMLEGYKWSYKNSQVKKDSKSNKAIDWFFKSLFNDTLKNWKNVRVYHTGLCGRCGEFLTSPESLRTGFGPKCLALEIKEGTYIVSDNQAQGSTNRNKAQEKYERLKQQSIETSKPVITAVQAGLEFPPDNLDIQDSINKIDEVNNTNTVNVSNSSKDIDWLEPMKF